MSEEQRMKIFNEFQNPPNDGIYRILFNCRVVGTGIDLKCIDMISFIDPRKQPVIITQNIFRGTRSNPHDNRRSAVFLPVIIEGEAVEGATKEERDAIIKKQLHDSCYKQLAEFLHCLKQHDIRWEEIFVSGSSPRATISDNKEDNNNDKEKKEKNSVKLKKPEQMLDHVKVTIDISICWDINIEDLRDMTIETVRLIGASSNQQSAIEKAKIAFDFIIRKYQKAPPSLKDTTAIPNYGDGNVKIGFLYDSAKKAKRKQVTTGVYGILAKLLDSSEYKHWHEQTNEEKAKFAFDFIIRKYENAPPVAKDKKGIPGYGDGTVQIGQLYQRTKDAKRKQRMTGVCWELAKLLDSSGYTHWHNVKNKKQTDKEKAKIAFDFIIQKYQKAPPIAHDKTFIPNYGDGNVRIGHLYDNAKITKRTNIMTGVHGELVKLLDSSDYKYWHDLIANDTISKKQTTEEKAKIAFDFVIRNYQKAPPSSKDRKTTIPNYGDGNVRIGNLYDNAKMAKRKNILTGAPGELSKLFNASDYKYWHDLMDNYTISKKQTTEEKAKIAFDFVIQNYQKAPPSSKDKKTTVPNYGDGNVKIGILYGNAKQAKRKRTTKGVYGEIAKLFDASDYKYWHDIFDKDDVNRPTAKRPRNDEPDDIEEIEEIEEVLPIKITKICAHVWKEVKTDDTHRYVVCEICDRNSKQRRVAMERGYKEPNPDKKMNINDWLARQDYIPGCAWLLDSHGMKTTRALIGGKRFRSDEIMVPEYDDDVFEENNKDNEIGSCLLRGDFLDNIKRAKRDDFSLIYADFTGRYETFVKPLFQHLEETRLRAGTFVGVTWSNNGAGTQTERSKIYRDLGFFMHQNDFEPIDDPVVSESGYGDGGNMNIQFMIKKH